MVETNKQAQKVHFQYRMAQKMDDEGRVLVISFEF